MMRKDKLNVRIHEVYPLQDVARAHEVSFRTMLRERVRLMIRLAGYRKSEDHWKAVDEAITAMASLLRFSVRVD